ncbi:MAG: SIMPL domain-containing protein [Thermoproteota archaeon]|nr:SIMPL domain-containing protein [Thermoproteota archaeon]
MLPASSVNGQQSITIEDEKPTIFVVGQAEKEISPDQARIALALENTAPNANLARKNNADKMTNIISVLRSNGLTNENISTTNFEIRPNYDYENNNYNKIVSYTAINNIILTVSANANLSSFLDPAVNSGANRVDSIEFIASENIKRGHYNELLKEAYVNAKEKADILSAEGDFLLNGVKKIELSPDEGILQRNFDSYSYGATAAEKTSAPSTPIIPQKNTIRVTLPVIFYITNQNLQPPPA